MVQGKVEADVEEDMLDEEDCAKPLGTSISVLDIVAATRVITGSFLFLTLRIFRSWSMLADCAR